MDLRENVKERKIMAVLRNVPDEIFDEYAGAVVGGGVTMFEIAMNSRNAAAQIARLKEKFGGKCFVGAGTALTAERCRSAVDAGADFVLTPGTTEKVLSYCAEHGIEMIPGVLTPTDVALCGEYGFSTLKLFPAASMPATYVKDLKAPFDDTEYVAIGGVNKTNIKGFFDAGCIGAGLGSGLMPKDAVAGGDWDACRKAVAELVKMVNR